MVFVVFIVVVPFGWTFGKVTRWIDDHIGLGCFHDAYERLDGHIELLKVSIQEGL